LSSGSGDASLVSRTSTNSASSLRRLITSPTRLRRTPSLVRIPLYSETMSSLTSQVKVACSIQSRRKRCAQILDHAPGLESRDAGGEHRSIDNSSRPIFPTSQR
jgi:hypothetical protein